MIGANLPPAAEADPAAQQVPARGVPNWPLWLGRAHAGAWGACMSCRAAVADTALQLVREQEVCVYVVVSPLLSFIGHVSGPVQLQDTIPQFSFVVMYVGEVYEREEHEHLVRAGSLMIQTAFTWNKNLFSHPLGQQLPAVAHKIWSTYVLGQLTHRQARDASVFEAQTRETAAVSLPPQTRDAAVFLFSQVRTVEERDTEYTMDLCVRPDINWDGSDKTPEEAAE